MQNIPLGCSTLRGSRLAFGCWRLVGTWDPAEITPEQEAHGVRAIHAAIDAGFTIFDHADVYCQGFCERLFGRVLRETPSLREPMVIVTKCGIRRPGDPAGAPYRYDFSKDHIVASCERSLKSLEVDKIDVLLLHRPDYLMDPAEVAGAFDALRRAGKVLEFGVSNFAPSQLAALQQACPMPLIVNQIEASLAHLQPFEDGTLDLCLKEKVTPMAWSPLAGGKLADGARRLLPSQEAYQTDAMNQALDVIGRARGTSRTTIAIAWLLKHPAGIIPIIGSTDPKRIQESALAVGVELSREEWYGLMATARQTPLP